MPGTKLVVLAVAVAVASCGGSADQNTKTTPHGSTDGLGSLSPADRMPVIRAKNDVVVAHTDSVDAEEEYSRYAARLGGARKKKEALRQIKAMEGYVEYLRSQWMYQLAQEQVKEAKLALARAKLAKKKNISGYGAVAVVTKRVATDRALAKAAKKRVDSALVRARVPDVWALSKNTSHNRASRLEQAIEFFEKMSTVIAKAKSNCRRMANGLQSLFLSNSPMVSRLRDGIDAPFQKIHEGNHRFRQRADAATQKMTQGLAACIRNARVRRLIERLSPRRPRP